MNQTTKRALGKMIAGAETGVMYKIGRKAPRHDIPAGCFGIRHYSGRYAWVWVADVEIIGGPFRLQSKAKKDLMRWLEFSKDEIRDYVGGVEI